MNLTTPFNNTLQDFTIVGINYRKSDITMRGKFSVTPEQCGPMVREAITLHIPGCLVLSTCNRTEVYGICDQPERLADLLCKYTSGRNQDVESHGYVFRGLDAIKHLLKVASGLDSQIIGDYEILSQLKQAAKVAKENGGMDGFMERAVNFALQASKEIKTKTKLSSGTVSVSYAAIQIIKERVGDMNFKKILLVGTGKFGKQIALNLRDYLPGGRLSFCNRTDEKAYLLSGQLDSGFVAYRHLAEACDEADVIVVSSSSDNYMVPPTFFHSKKPRLVLDLSSPRNVDPMVGSISGIELLNVDEVSEMLNKTVSAREAEVPKALKIISDTVEELEYWHRQQANSPLLQKVKSQLHDLNKALLIEEDKERIHKAVSSLAVDLKHNLNKGCACVAALQAYLEQSLVTVEQLQ